MKTLFAPKYLRIRIANNIVLTVFGCPVFKTPAFWFPHDAPLEEKKSSSGVNQGFRLKPHTFGQSITDSFIHSNFSSFIFSFNLARLPAIFGVGTHFIMAGSSHIECENFKGGSEQTKALARKRGCAAMLLTANVQTPLSFNLSRGWSFAEGPEQAMKTERPASKFLTAVVGVLFLSTTSNGSGCFARKSGSVGSILYLQVSQPGTVLLPTPSTT
jgi:hypothetical protein